MIQKASNPHPEPPSKAQGGPGGIEGEVDVVGEVEEVVLRAGCCAHRGPKLDGASGLRKQLFCVFGTEVVAAKAALTQVAIFTQNLEVVRIF